MRISLVILESQYSSLPTIVIGPISYNITIQGAENTSSSIFRFYLLQTKSIMDDLPLEKKPFNYVNTGLIQ